MSRILITGGAGYIGSVLVPMILLNTVHEIIVIDNFMYRQTSLLDCCHKKRLVIVRGDARNEELMKKLLAQNIEFIIPMAAIVGEQACHQDPIKAESTNLEAIKMLLQIKDKAHKIIFPNTNSGYGIGREGIYCDEETPLNPISLYGRLKVDAEKLILQTNDSIALRLATVFGISPKMRLDLLVNDLTHDAVKRGYIVLFEGHFKRNYIHVRDVARAFMHCMQNFEIMKNQVYNVGLSDANLSKRELCEEIKKQVPNLRIIEDDIMKDPDKRNYIVSNEKIEKTKFKPQFSLQEGITELIKGYQIIRNNKFSNI